MTLSHWREVLKLSITYELQPGDTLDGVATRFYGSPSGAAKLFAANVDVQDWTRPGTIVTIPSLPQSQTVIQNTGDDTISLSVASFPDLPEVQFDNWTNVTVDLSLDGIDSVEFTVPFDPADEQMRAYFKPFAYHFMRLKIGGEQVFSGTIINVVPAITAEGNMLSVSAYSRPGVLADCQAPYTLFQNKSLEFESITIDALARILCEPFGITVAVDGDMGTPIEEATLRQDQKVLDFLIDLAKPLGVIINNDEKGFLRLSRIDVKDQPVAHLVDGQPSALAIQPQLNGQNFFSFVTAVVPPTFEIFGAGWGGDVRTVRNTFLKEPLRQHTFIATGIDSSQALESARTKMGRTVASAVSYDIVVPGIRNANGTVWKPGELVSVHAPSVMIYNPYTFLIRSVRVSSGEGSQTVNLTVVLPESFTGNFPGGLPWD